MLSSPFTPIAPIKQASPPSLNDPLVRMARCVLIQRAPARLLLNEDHALTESDVSKELRMSIFAAVLASIMGLTLGLLGGGGSILTVPILVYALGVDEKSAIATSLLVVGSTSAMALIAHARSGNVSWKTGLTFGAFGMLGAFLGGMAAKFIPGGALLMLFALLMLVTSVAMLRGKKNGGDEREGEDAPEKDLPIAKIALEGTVVGLVTGLVGAGGGFLVVPALVLLGGLSMKRAIGTSLLVIAMKSFAGFAGFAGHVSIDYALTLGFVGAAVVGTLVGVSLARRIEASKLRKGFAIFVLVMAFFILGKQVDPAMLEAAFSPNTILMIGLAAGATIGSIFTAVILRQQTT